MAIMRKAERHPGPVDLPDRLDGVYKVTEAFRSIAVAWESISAGAWSTAAIQSFAAPARRVALDLSTIGCGTLDKVVVDLVLALDAITVATTVTDQQLARVDHALAGIRVVTVQRLLSLQLSNEIGASEFTPILMAETCPRCALSGVCAVMRSPASQDAIV